jgi:hypothetical protein
MLLTVQQSRDLLEKHGVFAREICDKCGAVLGAVRFTRLGESEQYCSRECRGDVKRVAIRKGGRPRKYRTEIERQRAERQQGAERQRAFRAIQRNGKPLPMALKTNDVQTQESPSSSIPLTRHFSAPKRPLSERGSVRA